jgi:diguanylate cyclase (GGDEF)-like protein
VGLYFTAPIVGIALQMKMYGTTFSMPFHTLGLFFIFLLLEREEMMRDSLTYLYTRHNFEIRLEDKLKRLEAFTLVLVDLNDFKKINDTYGHVEGDKVLQIVSEILLKCTSVEDLVCRYGGDEFIMLIDFQNDIGNQLKKRINRELKKYNNSNDKYDIELSYGQLFVGEDDKLTKEQLIAEVDCRMYSDKQKCKKQKN